MERAAVAALFALVATAVGWVDQSAADAVFRTEIVRIKTQSRLMTISAEIANTPAKKARGLMFRRSLGANEGMLFLYSHAQEVHMWMRNTYISLDMLFIRSDGIIHRIERQTEPFSEAIIASDGDVTGVLELNGGGARLLGIRAGDRVIYDHFDVAQ